MYLAVLLLLTTTLLVVVAGQQDYCSLSSQHTMCKYSGVGSACGAVIKRGTGKADQDAVIKLHNQLRQKVALGQESRGSNGPQPSASNMRELVWDNELATVAQRLADQCVFNHDCGQCRRVARFQVGQNLYTSSSTAGNSEADWNTAIMAWYNEVAMFNGQTVNSYSFSGNTGHYTQMVWADTYIIGCGFITYPDGRFMTKLYACNYGPAGNFLSSPMYLTGPACSKCAPSTSCSSEYKGLCKVGKPFSQNDNDIGNASSEKNDTKSPEENGSDPSPSETTITPLSKPAFNSGTSFFTNGFGSTDAFSFLLNGFQPFAPFKSFRPMFTKFDAPISNPSLFNNFFKEDIANSDRVLLSCKFEQTSSDQCHFNMEPNIYTYQPYTGQGNFLTVDLMPGDKMVLNIDKDQLAPSTGMLCVKLTYLRVEGNNTQADESLELYLSEEANKEPVGVTLRGISRTKKEWIRNKITFRNVLLRWSIFIKYASGLTPRNVRLSFRSISLVDGKC